MRTYYIFNINKEMTILTKDSPYMLFKSLETIYHGNYNDISFASNLYNQISTLINKNEINSIIQTDFLDDEFYIHTLNYHQYHNKYSDERCIVEVKNSYLICKCNKARIRLLKQLKKDNFFVCDFDNKDYFWLNEIGC